MLILKYKMFLQTQNWFYFVAETKGFEKKAYYIIKRVPAGQSKFNEKLETGLRIDWRQACRKIPAIWLLRKKSKSKQYSLFNKNHTLTTFHDLLLEMF